MSFGVKSLNGTWFRVTENRGKVVIRVGEAVYEFTPEDMCALALAGEYHSMIAECSSKD